MLAQLGEATDAPSFTGAFIPLCPSVPSVVKDFELAETQENWGLEMLSQLGEAPHDEQFLPRRSRVDLLMLQNPGVAMRHEDRM